MQDQDWKSRIVSFEDLEAWQMARQLVNSLYTLARLKGLSKDFRLCSQLQAGGVSIMSNEMPFVERNVLKAHMGSGKLEYDAGITSRAKEGFERTHLQEKVQFYTVWMSLRR